jgi:hypothetical protein
MSSWRKDNVEVNVWDINRNYLGVGKVVWSKDPNLVPEEMRGSLFELFGTPRITMPNGRVIYGVECWWSEVKDTPKPTPQKLKFVAPFIAESPSNSQEPTGESK